MKKFANLLLLLFALFMAFSVAACAAYDGESPSGNYMGPPTGGDSDESDSDASASPDGMLQESIKKQLTAAEWNDISNYEFWNSLFQSSSEQGEAGIFEEYARDNRGLDTRYMREITVKSGSLAVAGATVKLYFGKTVIYSAVTDGAGKAYVFGQDGTRITAKSGEFFAEVPATSGKIEIQLDGFAPQPNRIELAVVTDTTGSMDDELKFLKKEISGVVRRVANATLADSLRLGTVFYRDYNINQEEAYLVRSFDFTEVTSDAGMLSALSNINAQSAGGGGDIPEAVEAGLEAALKLQWSQDSTKILFHVLDASYHDESEYQKRFATAVLSAAQKGIRIIPVAASGLDFLGQYIMRSAAILTGGTYAFLTDDSGIGDSHEEPVVGGYTVEYLSDLMVRLTVGYHTGNMGAPVFWKDSTSVE